MLVVIEVRCVVGQVLVYGWRLAAAAELSTSTLLCRERREKLVNCSNDSVTSKRENDPLLTSEQTSVTELSGLFVVTLVGAPGFYFILFWAVKILD